MIERSRIVYALYKCDDEATCDGRCNKDEPEHLSDCIECASEMLKEYEDQIRKEAVEEAKKQAQKGKIKLTTLEKRLARNYQRAIENDAIKKPGAWALYQTWKWADRYEAIREKRKKKNENS